MRQISIATSAGFTLCSTPVQRPDGDLVFLWIQGSDVYPQRLGSEAAWWLGIGGNRRI